MNLISLIQADKILKKYLKNIIYMNNFDYIIYTNFDWIRPFKSIFHYWFHLCVNIPTIQIIIV